MVGWTFFKHSPKARVGSQMVSDMTSRNFTVFFACPVCGACYSAVQERSRNVAPKVFLCEDCKSVVCGWSVCYDYTGWQRYDRQAQ